MQFIDKEDYRSTPVLLTFVTVLGDEQIVIGANDFCYRVKLSEFIK